MALDDARTTEDSAADHVSDHNTLHARFNQGSNLWTSTKSSADTPDDEFDSTTLDGKWTAVSGSSGTVDLFLAASTVTEVYDLSTRPGYLLMQTGTSDDVQLRQDYTLPDESCIVVAFTMAKDESSVGDNQRFALTLGDSDTSPTSGEFITAMVEQDTASFDFQYVSDTDSSGTESTVDGIATQAFLRIDRNGLVYSAWFSLSGDSWALLGEDTHSDVADNIWIDFTAASSATYAPIASVKWIRQGTSTLDPWSWSTE